MVSRRGVVGRAIRGEPQLVLDVGHDPDYFSSRGSGGRYVVPIRPPVRNRRAQPQAPTPTRSIENLRVLQMIGTQIAGAIHRRASTPAERGARRAANTNRQLQAFNAALQQLSLLDALTGVATAAASTTRWRPNGGARSVRASRSRYC
jgi:hypothetical protein